MHGGGNPRYEYTCTESSVYAIRWPVVPSTTVSCTLHSVRVACWWSTAGDDLAPLSRRKRSRPGDNYGAKPCGSHLIAIPVSDTSDPRTPAGTPDPIHGHAVSVWAWPGSDPSRPTRVTLCRSGMRLVGSQYPSTHKNNGCFVR